MNGNAKVKLGSVAQECRETWSGSQSGVPVVGLEHLVPCEIELKEWDCDIENTFSKKFRKGQVLLGRRRVYLKKAVVAPFDGICSGDITVIEATEGILPELLPFIIQNERFFDYAMQGSAGSLSPRVKWDHLKDYEFSLPPLPEQKALADKLWAAYRLKESYKKLFAATDEMVKAQFVEMFGDESNCRKDLLKKHVEEMFIGPFGSSLKNDCFVEDESKYCVVYEQKHAIDKDLEVPFRYVNKKKYDELKRFTIIPGDIIVSCRGTVGEVFLIPEGAPLGIMHPSIMKIRLKPDYLPEFFVYALTEYMRARERLNIGTGIKMAIKANDLGNQLFPFPTIEEQKKFVSIVQQAEQSKAELRKSIEAIDRVIKSLING